MSRRRLPPVFTSTAASARPPMLSLIFGFGPAFVLVALGTAAWLAPSPWPPVAAAFGVVWGAAILIFIAGVRRGLSFFTQGGPQPLQMAAMAWLFLLGLAALVIPGPAALAPLILGYLDVAIIDPVLARQGEAPRHFAGLRPIQAVLFLIGVGLIAARALA